MSRYKTIIFSLILTLIVPQTIYAASSPFSTNVINNIQIGDISIKLEEFQLDADNSLIPYENNKIVLPGQHVDKIVRITNMANEAWVRAKVSYTSEDGIEDMSEELITLDDGKWKKIGDYYYYTEPLKNKQDINFINAVCIPPEWDGDYADKSFSIIISADAVQKDNFTPDFNSTDPWFGTVIETCVHSSFNDTSAGTDKFSVTFEGGAEGLVRVGDDFFSNFGNLMPGDVVEDKVSIKNNYHRTVDISFHTEDVSEDDVLGKIQLQIMDGDKVLYAGPMKRYLSNEILIAHLRNGEEKEINFKLSVPDDLNNPYALATTKTKWVFKASVRFSGGSSGGGSGSVSGENNIKHNESNPIIIPFPEALLQIKEKTGDIINSLPKLGDTNIAVYGMAVMLLSGLGIFILTRKKKEEQDED